jgi:hypothetical protein
MNSAANINILCRNKTSRLEYVVLFLSETTGIHFSLVTHVERPDPHALIINYHEQPVRGAFNVYSTGLLFESGLKTFEPEVSNNQKGIYLFPAPAGFNIGFDIFSGIFFLLSRYEEYLPFKSDKFGRFEAGESLAFKKGFLSEPVVDQWMLLLQKSLTLSFPGLQFPERKYNLLATFDVDNPWAYLHKGILRTFFGLLKTIITIDYAGLTKRMNVFTGKMPDPFDTYAYISELENRTGVLSLFFFLSGSSGKHDTNYALPSPAFHKLLKQLHAHHKIGIHPSYKSNRCECLLQTEFDGFAKILGKKPDLSRQHFLILRLPETYQRLIDLGIKEDYTMGYATHTGFRAGTSLPFRFYDLHREVITDLIIFPFAVMDVTLKRYLQLNPDEAIDLIASLKNKIRAVNGTYTWLWHNESLSEQGEWNGWRKVFEGNYE